MKTKKRILTISVLCSFLFLPVFIADARQDPADNNPHKTGLRELTVEELKAIHKTQPRVKRVKLNKLGLERINAHRKQKGLSLISDEATVDDGTELETAIEAILGGVVEVPVADSSMQILPPVIDNSVLKYFPPIRDQGGLGSCGCFSGTYYAMTYMLAFANDFDAKNGGDTFRLSPKWTYNMVNGGSDSGSWYYWAYDVGIKHGVATWAEFPYDADYLAWCLNPDVWKASIYRRFDRYGYVANTNQESGITQVKQMLVDGYILNFPTYIFSWQYKTISNDPSTHDDDAFVGKSACYWVNGTSGYHAMTVVGYNDNIWVDINANGVVDTGEKGAFRIANSWSTDWGEAGFFWMAYDALKNPSAVSGGPNAGRVTAWTPPMAHWVVARTGYEPVLLAKFTLNHLKRDQLGITLGTSDTSQSVPSTIWIPNAIYYEGGAYVFDGSTVAVDGTFVFDFTDIAPAVSGIKRFYLGVYDSTALDPAQVKDFRLIDLAKTGEVISIDVPKTIDAGQAYCAIDYSYDSGNVAPIAVITVSTTSGIAPLAVSFDASASYDPDGSISAYQWDFGDGVTASGVVVSHTYTREGDFNARLTVTDNQGVAGSAIVAISVSPDPNIIPAPSGLTAKVSRSTVNLRWIDNSSVEDGFAIERAVKVKGTIGQYKQVAQVGRNVIFYTETISRGFYCYRVKAYNNTTGKSSGYSNTVSARVK